MPFSSSDFPDGPPKVAFRAIQTTIRFVCAKWTGLKNAYNCVVMAPMHAVQWTFIILLEKNQCKKEQRRSVSVYLFVCVRENEKTRKIIKTEILLKFRCALNTQRTHASPAHAHHTKSHQLSIPKDKQLNALSFYSILTNRNLRTQNVSHISHLIYFLLLLLLLLLLCFVSHFWLSYVFTNAHNPSKLLFTFSFNAV